MNKLLYIHKREYDSPMKIHRLLPLGAIWLKYTHINKRRMIIYISYDFTGIKFRTNLWYQVSKHRNKPEEWSRAISD